MKHGATLGLVLALALAAGARAQPGLTNYAPVPPAEPLTETVFGQTVSDPYRWMESPARKADLDAWLQATSAHTTTELAALPGYPGLLAELSAHAKASPRVRELRQAGQRQAFLRLAPAQDQWVLVLQDNARARTLLDPGREAIGGFSFSADGRYLYAQTSGGGSEVGTARLYDTRTAKPLPDLLSPVWGDDAASWIDDQTLTYTRLAATAGPAIQEGITSYLHRVGTPVSADVPLLGALARDVDYPVDESDAGWTTYRQGEPYLLGLVSTARADKRVAVAPIASVKAGRPVWAPVAEYADRVQAADLHGETLFLLSTRGNPDGAIVATPAGAPDLATATPVMGAKGLVIGNFVAGPTGLYVQTVEPNGASGLRFLPYGAGTARAVALPFPGSIDDIQVSADGHDVSMALTGWLHATRYFRLTGATATPLPLRNQTDATLVRGLGVVEDTATSADGTPVPLTLLLPAGGQRPFPTILEAYSSYGEVASPYYSATILTWVRRGGVFATCHARGGGELGRAWHDAGREASKPNGQADVIACGERLVKLGLASPRTLGAWGTSAGGLIVPPAGLKRPDLFRAVVASVAEVNVSRLGQAENGPMQFAEFGDPRTAAGYRALLAQDSGWLLASTRGGPDFLFTVGLNDHRVPPWQSAKVASMMRAKWGDDHLVLVRTDGDAGHGIGSGRDQVLRLRADMYAFLLNRFGAPGFGTSQAPTPAPALVPTPASTPTLFLDPVGAP